MPKIAAVFSGQGSQYPGMGKELYESFRRVREIYKCAGDILGFDVAKTSFEGSEEQLRVTAVSQPLIFTLSVAAFTAAREEMEPPAGVAGHSLGEYAALCCAGAYSLEDGLRIIRTRARVMDETVKATPGAMFAILGSDEATVTAACLEAGGFAEPVNYNLPDQTVISGDENACARAAEILAGKGAKAVRLGVSGAFHTRLMQPAADALKAEIAGIAFSPAKIPFYSNLTGGLLDIGDYPDYFARHMVSPVRFTGQAAAMHADGISICVEFGPKRTAVTLIKKNIKSMKVFGVEDGKSLAKFKEALDAGEQV